MSSGLAPNVVGLVLTDVWKGTLGLHHQMSFFMDCLNLDTWNTTVFQNSGHNLPNDTASHQGRPGSAGTPSWERHIYWCQWILYLVTDMDETGHRIFIYVLPFRIVTLLTFWRLNYYYFFLILAHTVYKMWIIQEPNTLELWNELHFEEGKKRRIYTMLKIFSTYICWINI